MSVGAVMCQKSYSSPHKDRWPSEMFFEICLFFSAMFNLQLTECVDTRAVRWGVASSYEAIPWRIGLDPDLFL